MPSDTHQWLLLWVARKMTADGYVLAAYDGPTPQGGTWNALPQPAEVGGVRPDAWGVRSDTGGVAVGEAKTAEDVATRHTQEQLQVFARLRQRSDGEPCRLYLAVPRSATAALDRVLGRVGLLGARHVVRMHVPDCLIEEDSDDDS